MKVAFYISIFLLDILIPGFHLPEFLMWLFARNKYPFSQSPLQFVRIKIGKAPEEWCSQDMTAHEKLFYLQLYSFAGEIVLLPFSYKDPQFIQGWSELTKMLIILP